MFNSRTPSTTPQVFRSQRDTVIIPLGLLQELNHDATGAAFIKLAQQPGRLPTGEKLDPTQLGKVMPQILAADAKIRAGKCDAKEFRKEILAILKLQASDEEFDTAWNAMQGDVSKLSRQLQTIKKQNENMDIILISKTNPIHVKNVYNVMQPEQKVDDAKESNPLTLLGIPLHVSYQSPGYKTTTSDVALYNEAAQHVDTKHTIIILQCSSNSPYPPVKKRDEEIANGIKQWAESQGMRVIDRKPQENIADAIARDIREQKEIAVKDTKQVLSHNANPAVLMTGFGSRLHSGKVRLWSFSETVNVPAKDEVTPNNVYRP